MQIKTQEMMQRGKVVICSIGEYHLTKKVETRIDDNYSEVEFFIEASCIPSRFDALDLLSPVREVAFGCEGEDPIFEETPTPSDSFTCPHWFVRPTKRVITVEVRKGRNIKIREFRNNALLDENENNTYVEKFNDIVFNLRTGYTLMQNYPSIQSKVFFDSQMVEDIWEHDLAGEELELVRGLPVEIFKCAFEYVVEHVKHDLETKSMNIDQLFLLKRDWVEFAQEEENACHSGDWLFASATLNRLRGYGRDFIASILLLPNEYARYEYDDSIRCFVRYLPLYHDELVTLYGLTGLPANEEIFRLCLAQPLFMTIAFLDKSFYSFLSERDLIRLFSDRYSASVLASTVGLFLADGNELQTSKMYELLIRRKFMDMYDRLRVLDECALVMDFESSSSIYGWVIGGELTDFVKGHIRTECLNEVQDFCQ